MKRYQKMSEDWWLANKLKPVSISLTDAYEAGFLAARKAVIEKLKSLDPFYADEIMGVGEEETT